MSGSYVLSEMSTNFFECAICLEKYTNPKTLPCGHTFCGSPKPCMKGLEKATGIKCCVCREQHKVKEAGLKTNIFIRDVVEQSRRQNTFEASATSNNSRTDSEAPSTSKATKSLIKIATPPDWSRVKIVASSAAVKDSFNKVNCAGQYIFTTTKEAGPGAIRKYMWFESEAGIELVDMAKNDFDCSWLRVAATQRENGSILVYAGIDSSTDSRGFSTRGLFHIDPDTLKTRGKVSLPSAIEGLNLCISAWEDYVAMGGEETVAILRNKQIVCRMDTRSRLPAFLSLTPAYVVFMSQDYELSVYRWRRSDGTVLDEPVCLRVFDKCAGTAVSGDTLLAAEVASKRLVRINISTGKRVHMIGDLMVPYCFIRHDLVAGTVKSSNGLALGVAELS